MQYFFSSLYLISSKLITETNAEISLTLQDLNVNYPQLHVWWGALSTTFLISVIPYLILYCIPLNNTPEYESHLKICLSLAAGGLLGDAFLHLIPEALTLNGIQSRCQSQSVGLWILFGFISFFVVEKCVRIAKNYSIYPISGEVNEDNNQLVFNKINNNIKVCDKQHKDIKESEVLTHLKDMKIAGYLNLVADLVHNFTDGLAIGSSFLSGHNVGLVTGIAIMVHEIPHEIGDYAVLIRSGCSRKKAMSLQLLTAIGAVTGTVVSLVLGTSGGAGSNWVLPFTGGGFIYIGTVTILPELTDKTDLKQSFKEIFALIFGLFLMTLIV